MPALSRSRRSARSNSPSAPRTHGGWAAAGGVLGALLALVCFAPAHWLAQAVSRATQEKVQLQQARGTVWTGSAQLVLTGGPASRDRSALPGAVHWQLRPALTGLVLALRADCCTPQALQVRVNPRWSGVQLALDDGLSQWPAALLAGLGTPWNTLEPQGQLALRTTGVQATWASGRMVLAGQAQLDARAMSSRLSTLRPMGSYRLVLQGAEVSTLTLSTLDGHLQLQGSGQWVGQRLRFTGEASASPEREAALSNLLNIIGRRSGARSIITVG